MKNLLTVLILIASLSLSGQTPVQNFSLTNVADGSVVSLEGFPTCSGLAIVFTSNVCPYDAYYKDRIRTWINTYQGKIQFLLINSYREAEESADKMKVAYGSWSVSAPYLADKDQVAMECVGAKKSPEVFLLKPLNGKYTVVFSGALDDNPQAGNAVVQNHLKTAIEQLLAGQKIEPAVVRAVGCTIRKK